MRRPLLRLLQGLLGRYSERFLSKWSIFGVDLILVAVAFAFSQWVKYFFTESVLPTPILMGRFSAYLAVFALGFLLFKSHTGVIRLSGSVDFFRLVKVTTFAFLGLLGIREIAHLQHLDALVFSQGGLILTCLFFLTASVGFRITVRSVFQSIKQTYTKKNGIGILIFGAGSMGQSAKEAIESDRRSEGYPVAFVDDNPNKLGKTINGLPILSSEFALEPGFVADNNVQRVVLAVKNISQNRVRSLTERALALGLEVKRVPPIGKWVNGGLTATQLRSVSLEDLLGREPIFLSSKLLHSFVEGKTILITGAAGSIGSELVRQVLAQNAARVVAVDQAETPLYQLNEEFASLPAFIPLVADVVNEPRMEWIFSAFQPDVVFHAAAYKHVPLMEAHPEEAIRTNCLGTAAVARLAREHGCEAFVMVSTDKAVNPTNVMGASKRIAELVVQAENNHPDNRTRFVTTRFGNVLGSNGSVIPLFQKQLAAGGPLTVTHKEVTRYFMTIPEAVRLVLEAGFMGQGGELYVFDMGEPVRIYDLAVQMIQLSGLRPGLDIEIQEVGLRPGEKLYEELLADNENTLPTHHPKIYIAKANALAPDAFQERWTHLHRSLVEQNLVGLMEAIAQFVPEYQPNGH